MKKLIPTFLFSLLTCLVPGTANSEEISLLSTDIFSKGPNKFNGDILEITKGRGATIGWYISAKKEEDVRVSVEYSCSAPLNQDYQLSFDGYDRFW